MYQGRLLFKRPAVVILFKIFHKWGELSTFLQAYLLIEMNKNNLYTVTFITFVTFITL